LLFGNASSIGQRGNELFRQNHVGRRAQVFG
jgi:hypothetical protein